MKPYESIARSLVPTRAFENQLFVAYANHCGQEGDIEYCGLSCVCGPDGADIARAGSSEELIVAELNQVTGIGNRLLLTTCRSHGSQHHAIKPMTSKRPTGQGLFLQSFCISTISAIAPCIALPSDVLVDRLAVRCRKVEKRKRNLTLFEYIKMNAFEQHLWPR
jgi:hypothetical protein